MKTKDFAALNERLQNLSVWSPKAIASEIDRAVRKARREFNARGTECPVCGWKPKRAKKGQRP